jgi:hypothetical protein
VVTAIVAVSLVDLPTVVSADLRTPLSWRRLLARVFQKRSGRGAVSYVTGRENSSCY